MFTSYSYPYYSFQSPPELIENKIGRYPLVVVGAGPVGLAAAIDLAQSGIGVVLLDEDKTVSVGSRGVCYAKRTLEILDRLGVGNACVDKGITWNIGRTFFDEKEVYQFNVQPLPGFKRPGMVNLQQYYLEDFLVQRAQEIDILDLRFQSKLLSTTILDDGLVLTVETPEGNYSIHTDWLIAADGSRSPIRRQLGLDVEGKIFHDHFLIADVMMKADFPAERWFWFDPPFHRSQSVLLHKQADNVWRIDFQLGCDADPEEEKKAERVIPRIKAMLGDDREFDIEWVSVYTFQCRRMEAFRHGRVLFAGDSAHQVSPFGARGANSGIQDSDNLCWKIKLVIEGNAPEKLLDSYNHERSFAADENILNSTRSTDFITPKSNISRNFRNATLVLARHYNFARTLVNSGRLSVPSFLLDSPLNSVEDDAVVGNMVAGAPLDDAPMVKNRQSVWLLEQLGNQFFIIYFLTDIADAKVREQLGALQTLIHKQKIAIQAIVTATPEVQQPYQKIVEQTGLQLLIDSEGFFQQRYDASQGSVYLIRPDQHLCARWRRLDAKAVSQALKKATGH